MTSGVVCFGELLLRLNAPGRELLLQSGELRVHVGGAEANVAVSLASFGHPASVVSVVPDNPLGAACVSELRRHGVRTDGIRKGPGRLGIYFMATGAGNRPSEIVYDRADSAFALRADEAIDWNQALAGARWLHVSGITPALGARAAEATLRAARAARERGVSVSFDCNYRAKLWEAWRGDPAKILREVVDQSDLVFADDRALALVLSATPGTGASGPIADIAGAAPADGDSNAIAGIVSPGAVRGESSASRGEAPRGESSVFRPEPGGPRSESSAPAPAAARFKTAAEQAFKAFPRLQRVATTLRTEHNVDRHDLSAVLATRQGLVSSRGYSLEGIVDRIGTGDAFAAGLLHGLLVGMDEQHSLDFALAAAVLKHSIPGDFNLATAAQVSELVAGRGFAVRR